MFRIAEYLTKIDAGLILIPFFFCIWFLIKTKERQIPLEIKAFCIFIIYITFIQAVMSIMAYSKIVNLHIQKYLIPGEFFTLSFILIFIITNKKSVTIIWSTVLSILVFLLAIFAEEKTNLEIPSIAILIEYTVITILLLISLPMIAKKDKYHYLPSSLLRGLLFYSISGLAFAASNKPLLIESYVVLAIFGIISKGLFVHSFIILKEGIWN